MLVLWGLNHTSSDVGYRAILADGDPYKAEVDRVREDFPPATSVLFVFESATGDLFQPETLRAMETLHQRYTEIRSAVSVGSIMNRRLDDPQAERLGRDYLIPDPATLSSADMPALRAEVLADPDLVEGQMSPAGDLAIAGVKYKAQEDTQEERLRIADSVIALRDDLRAEFPEAAVYTLGGVLFERDGHLAQVNDRNVLFPLVMAVSVLLLWLCLRSLSYSLSLFVVAFLSVGLSVGSWGWLDIPFNQISGLGPIVVFVIAIADGIHIVSIYAQGLHQGRSPRDAMRDSLRVNLQPVTLATITTAMGFLSLNYCTSPGIYGFGNVIALGVIWAYFVTLTLLPALILLLPRREVPKPLGVQGFIRAVDTLVKRHGDRLLIGGGILVLVTLALLPLNKMDFNRFNFVDEDSDYHKILTALQEKIGNDQSLVYSVDSGSYYGITEDRFLEQVNTFSEWLESQPEASFVASYTDYLRGRFRSEHDDDPAYDRLPEDKLQVIDYLVGYQLVQEIEPSLEPIFNGDYSAIRLVIGTSNLSNAEMINFNDRIEGWIDTHLDPSYEVLHGDNSILFARLDRSITIELMQGFSVSFLLITLTMIIGLRSLRYGTLSVLPNLFPATIVFGFWGLFIGELSPYILMLFSISIGLVVDDSVHILSKYVSARRDGAEPDAAVSYSLDKGGSAITITTASLAAGTLLLLFSNTFHFQNVALLLTPIIVVAWLLDLLVLPPLLVRYDQWRSRRATPAAPSPTPA